MPYKRRSKKRINSNKANLLVVSLLLFVSLAGLTLYLLPYLSYFKIERAIATGNAAEVVAYINKKTLWNNLLKAPELGVKKMPTGKESVASLVDLAMMWASASKQAGADRMLTVAGTKELLTDPGKREDRRDELWPPWHHSSSMPRFAIYRLTSFP